MLSLIGNCRVGPVDEQQVDIVQPEPLEALLDRPLQGALRTSCGRTLVVTKTSSRPIPEARMPAPTAASLS